MTGFIVSDLSRVVGTEVSLDLTHGDRSHFFSKMGIFWSAPMFFNKKNDSTAHSLIGTSIANISPHTIQQKTYLLEKLRRKRKRKNRTGQISRWGLS